MPSSEIRITGRRPTRSETQPQNGQEQELGEAVERHDPADLEGAGAETIGEQRQHGDQHAEAHEVDQDRGEHDHEGEASSSLARCPLNTPPARRHRVSTATPIPIPLYCAHAGGRVGSGRDRAGVPRRPSAAAARQRALPRGALAFDEVGELVGDDERSVLFRLKERCHVLFRGERGEGEIGATALFDLAVGSLFHEAMKFRENFYQRSSYGPKVRALRRAVVRDESGLLKRVREADRRGGRPHRRVAPGARHAARPDHRAVPDPARRAPGGGRPGARRGGADRGAGRRSSALRPMRCWRSSTEAPPSPGREPGARSSPSGFFSEAASAFGEAARLGRSAPEDTRLLHFAEGMAAYLDGRYARHGRAARRLVRRCARRARSEREAARAPGRLRALARRSARRRRDARSRARRRVASSACASPRPARAERLTPPPRKSTA